MVVNIASYYFATVVGISIGFGFAIVTIVVDDSKAYSEIDFIFPRGVMPTLNTLNLSLLLFPSVNPGLECSFQHCACLLSPLVDRAMFAH